MKINFNTKTIFYNSKTFVFKDKIDLLSIITNLLNISYSEMKQAHISSIKNNISTESKLFTIREYQKIRKISRQRIYQLLKENKIVRIKYMGYAFIYENKNAELK